jgi:hypothetical protein
MAWRGQRRNEGASRVIELIGLHGAIGEVQIALGDEAVDVPDTSSQIVGGRTLSTLDKRHESMLLRIAAVAAFMLIAAVVAGAILIRN